MEEGSEGVQLGRVDHCTGRRARRGPLTASLPCQARGAPAEHSQELRRVHHREGQAWPDLHFRMVTVTGAWGGGSRGLGNQ